MPLSHMTDSRPQLPLSIHESQRQIVGLGFILISYLVTTITVRFQLQVSCSEKAKELANQSSQESTHEARL